jgi:hypothetical protein
MPRAIARSGLRETVFMIAGIGVHDQLERPFRITGIPEGSTRSREAIVERAVMRDVGEA